MLHGRHDRKIEGSAQRATAAILCDWRAFSKNNWMVDGAASAHSAKLDAVLRSG
jgi:hypothetical protein